MIYRRILRFPLPRLPNLSILIDKYNQGLEKHPYTTKAIGTGVTYMFSDITAQCLESINLVSQPVVSFPFTVETTDKQPLVSRKGQIEGSNTEENNDKIVKSREGNVDENKITFLDNVAGRIERTLKFSLVGFLWVGPLLTAWFQLMEKFIPGKHLIPLTKKVFIDQVIQGPLMIGSMYFWTAYLNGKTLAEIYKRLEDVLFETWVNSVYVWGPVQVLQQGIIPLKYRVAFFQCSKLLLGYISILYDDG